MNFWFPFLLLALLAVSYTAPPRDTGNACSMFQEKQGWYQNAQAAARRWAAPLPVQLAIINQESAFVDDARPPRIRFHGIPLWRPSSAYGYGQATDQTWVAYEKATGHYWADRDDFADATDFIGWYMQQTASRLGIAKTDAYHQYLAYHEGHEGYRRGMWRAKAWLADAARRVQAMAGRYQRQLNACRPALDASLS